MKVFKIYLDSFKDSYSGYWSSLEKACEELPKSAKFRRSVRWTMPGGETIDDVYHSPDFDYNQALKIELTITPMGIQIKIPGFRRLRTKTTYIEEVKEEGKPYSPAQQIRQDLEPEILSRSFGFAEVTEIQVDEVDES